VFYLLTWRIFERGGDDREADAISIYRLIEFARVLQRDDLNAQLWLTPYHSLFLSRTKRVASARAS